MEKGGGDVSKWDQRWNEKRKTTTETGGWRRVVEMSVNGISDGTRRGRPQLRLGVEKGGGDVSKWDQ